MTFNKNNNIKTVALKKVNVKKIKLFRANTKNCFSVLLLWYVFIIGTDFTHEQHFLFLQKHTNKKFIEYRPSSDKHKLNKSGK